VNGAIETHRGLRARRWVRAVAAAAVLSVPAAGLVVTATPAAAYPSSAVTLEGHGYGHGHGRPRPSGWP
jgi:hypothetical protein